MFSIFFMLINTKMRKNTMSPTTLHSVSTRLVPTLVSGSIQNAKKVDEDKRRELRWDEECDLSLLGLQLH